MREALASPTSASGRAKRAGRPPVPSHPLTGWKGALLVAGVAAACGASYIAGDRTADPGAPEMVVTLTDANGGVGGILEVGDDDMLRFVPLALDGRTGSEAPRLWTIYDETIGYVPLGTLLAAEARRWRGPNLPPPVPGQRYRVTSGAGAAAVPDGLVLFEGSARAVGGR
jgi:hypothetical protein